MHVPKKNKCSHYCGMFTEIGIVGKQLHVNTYMLKFKPSCLMQSCNNIGTAFYDFEIKKS